MKRTLLILLTLVALGVTAVSVTGTVFELGIVTNYIGLSTDTKPATSVKTGSMFLETDTGRAFIYNGTTWVMNTLSAVKDTVTMSAPATTAAIYCKGFDRVTWYFKVAAINTSVAVALQARKGNGDWYAVEQDSLVYTANGNYGLTWSSAGTADSTRFKWISEAGGTDAAVTTNAGLSGGGGLGMGSFPGMVR